MKTHHDVINTNLFFARGEQWKRIRTITSSTFTTKKMKQLCSLIRTNLQEYLDLMDEIATSGQSFDAKEMHENFTLDVITCCAFASKTNSIKDPKSPLISACRELFDMKIWRFIPAFVFPEWLNRLLNIKSFVSEDSNQFIIKLLKQIIEKRRQNREKNNDLLQLLIDAKVEDDYENETNDTIDDDFQLQNGINPIKQMVSSCTLPLATWSNEIRDA